VWGGVAGIGHGGGSWLILVALSVIATLTTAIICLNSSTLGAFTQLIDRPDLGRKLHGRDTPIVAGLAMMIPALALTIAETLLFHANSFMLPVTFAASMVMAVGVLDDRLDVSPAWRFLALFFVVYVAFSVEPLFVIRTLNLDLLGNKLSIPLHSLAGPVTLLMVVGFTNAVNMADGMNGQLLGSMLIWSMLLLRYVPAAETAPIAGLVCCSAAALVFNLRGKVFSGSAGAYAGAVFVGLSAIAIYRETHSNLAAVTVAIWFWLPVADCLRLMATRMLASRSPFSGDRQHLHHHLLARMSHANALTVYLALLGLPALVTEINAVAGQLMLGLCAAIYVALVLPRERERGTISLTRTAIDAAE